MQNTTGPEFVNFSIYNDGLVVKAFLSMTPCFLLLYVNVIMMFTLSSKEIFFETPRYMLFGHLLLSDSLQLSSSILSYILAMTRVYMVTYACAFYYLVQRIINFISPLCLALMSLERYVAICFPLRHAEIANRRTTNIAVAVVWLLCMMIWAAELTVNLMFEILSPTKQMMCSYYLLVQMEISLSINKAFTAIVFISVSLVIIYTFIATSVTAKSAISNETSARKAHRTILLHMVQLGLCLLSTLFSMIRRSLVLSKMTPVVIVQVQYVLFVGVIIFPRCLSPLIYGLRDKTFSVLFKHYFFFCLRRKVEPSTLQFVA